jgi:hypothetical protein
LLDGDSAHGNPGEPAGDEVATDTDTDAGFDDTDTESAGITEDDLRDATTTEEAVEDPSDDEDQDEDETSDAEPDEDDVLTEQQPTPHPANMPSVGTPQTGRMPSTERTADTSRLPAAHRADPSGEFPIRGYERLTVPEVVRRASKLERHQLASVLAFEKSNRNRKTLVVRLQRLVAKG